MPLSVANRSAGSGRANEWANSPRMAAQRRQIDSLFGGAVQRRHTGENELQRQQEVSSGLGLPTQLRAGIEAMSGMDMSDVQVHCNSTRPAQLNALAYAQGNEIYLGPGQEQHLPHEAWHVVQQRQGRVQPTLQLQSGGINDDAALEREADRMGLQATQLQTTGVPHLRSRDASGIVVMQRLSADQAQVLKEEKDRDAFDKLETALQASTTTAAVRLAVRAKSMNNNSWKWQSVGHSSIQLSVYQPASSQHIQIGLDNGGTVKIEANLYKSADNDRYDVVLLEQTIDRATARALLTSMREEVGKSHAYKEWIIPTFEALGAENCTTWALKMGEKAGISVPASLASSLGLVPDPASLAARIRSKDEFDSSKSERRVDMKYGDATHIIGKDGRPDIIIGDTNSDVDAAKWEAVAAILEARSAGGADPAEDELSYCFPPTLNLVGGQKAALYQAALSAADTVDRKAEELAQQREEEQAIDAVVQVAGLLIMFAFEGGASP